ncbi:MAG TPA: LysM peptidoglycan-binding domain-containing protein [Anaerolineales bacterium]|nr:LysM peptidoglycan-binding domain-containing protein [Anaerolineales bacterium]
MLNRTPQNTNNTINSFRKKRQFQGRALMYGSIALVALGLILLIYWLTRPTQPLGQFFATDTPTVTVTATTTNTATATATATITETPTITMTATPSEPFPYIIQEGDTLDAIAQRFNLGGDGVLLILDQNPQIMTDFGGIIQVGQEITIPLPGTTRATTTPIPADLRSGTLVEYQVLPGDTLAGIAVRFNSLADEIIAENEIENANALQVGDVLQIPVNLVTPTATLPPTSTPVTPTVAGGTATSAATTAASTRAPGGAATCSFNENPQFVTQLQTLINEERTSAGLPALDLNAQLTAAAEAHAEDMLCNNYFSPLALNGSTPEERVEAAGYDASLVVELLYALHPSLGGNPPSALEWWLNNPDSRADLLNPNTSDFGVAYVSSDDSLFGGYFVVVAASP